MDPHKAPAPSRLSGGPSWWHDDYAVVFAVATVLGIVGTAVYMAFQTGLVP